MTKDEFEYNKELLKEIVTKKNDVQGEIETVKNDLYNRAINKPSPAYQVYSI